MSTKINVNKASILSCTNIFPNICVKISKSSKTLKVNNLLPTQNGPLQKMVKPIFPLREIKKKKNREREIQTYFE